MTKTFKIIALIALCAAIGAAPVCAGEPVFPNQSRVGLVPLPGFAVDKGSPQPSLSDRFGAQVILCDENCRAFQKIASAFNEGPLWGADLIEERREKFDSRSVKGTLAITHFKGNPSGRVWILLTSAPARAVVMVVVQDKDSARYEEAGVRKMLATMAVRDKIPEGEAPLSAGPGELGRRLCLTRFCGVEQLSVSASQFAPWRCAGPTRYCPVTPSMRTRY